MLYDNEYYFLEILYHLQNLEERKDFKAEEEGEENVRRRGNKYKKIRDFFKRRISATYVLSSSILTEILLAKLEDTLSILVHHPKSSKDHAITFRCVAAKLLLKLRAFLEHLDIEQLQQRRSLQV